LFTSRDVAAMFVKAWVSEVARGSEVARSGDSSATELMLHFVNGAELVLECRKAPNPWALQVGETLSCRVVSLDQQRGLLLYPDSPYGVLYTPKRLGALVLNTAKWNSALQVGTHPHARRNGAPPHEPCGAPSHEPSSVAWCEGGARQKQWIH
jgi:hypothetical protein